MTALIDPARPPRSIAVFRALQLGDMLCTVPALRALRRACPDSRILLVGLAGARGFVSRFSAYVDELLEFPGVAAFPEQAPREQELPAFYRRMRALRPDVALQMHGSGGVANGIVARFGARRWGGFVPEAAEESRGARMLWPDTLPEPQRYLRLLRHVGVPAEDDRLELPLSAADEAEVDALMERHDLRRERLVLMHVGARLPSRRWPVARYAEVANRLCSEGWQVVLTGTQEERPLLDALRALTGARLGDVAGQTSLGGLAALVRRSRLLVCNDTGISHVAAAVGARSVVIASGSDVRRWAPRDTERNPVLAADMPCRPCSVFDCPIGHPCALAVTVPMVMAQVRRQLAEPAP
ncbi:LPS biosynthesis glycosyltransferase [Bordetella genomosp. 5]|uniref:glycosyltransferase family 9 protein n=1 Tax=Bordetella genomosp. 5 TaxID=1395608 RepID=UPI000B9DEEF2|nr:glycosyltransferase family 9 protein [Bordetella genomosp. 5]OZI43768.1 LPS biosynthesis glycosyltransferase [Bordetella genomosp. 5]